MFDAAKNSPNMFKGKLRYLNVETTINAIAQYGGHFQFSTVHNQLYHETLTDWLPLWKKHYQRAIIEICDLWDKFKSSR